jgi:hypothetical protein
MGGSSSTNITNVVNDIATNIHTNIQQSTVENNTLTVTAGQSFLIQLGEGATLSCGGNLFVNQTLDADFRLMTKTTTVQSSVIENAIQSAISNAVEQSNAMATALNIRINDKQANQDDIKNLIKNDIDTNVIQSNIKTSMLTANTSQGIAIILDKNSALIAGKDCTFLQNQTSKAQIFSLMSAIQKTKTKNKVINEALNKITQSNTTTPCGGTGAVASGGIVGGVVLLLLLGGGAFGIYYLTKNKGGGTTPTKK